MLHFIFPLYYFLCGFAGSDGTAPPSYGVAMEKAATALGMFHCCLLYTQEPYEGFILFVLCTVADAVDAPPPAIRFSAVLVEIRAMGRPFVAIFRIEKYGIPFTKTFSKIPENLLPSTVDRKLPE